jgi:hypothetical protein
VRLDPKLTAFNRRFAMAVRDVFSDDVAAEQNVNGNLCFCGPQRWVRQELGLTVRA